MSSKEELRQMLDNIIDGQSDQAQTNFHQYLKSLIQDRLTPKQDDQQQK